MLERLGVAGHSTLGSLGSLDKLNPVPNFATLFGATSLEVCVLKMEHKPKMVAEARLFIRLGLLSFIGFGFYYAHLFFGILNDEVVFKALAITFLIATIPLPILAVNNKQLFPELPKTGKTMLTLVSAMLLFHHFLMTFVFVMFLRSW